MTPFGHTPPSEMSIRIVTFLLRLTFSALRLDGGVATMISPFSYLYQTGAACMIQSLFRLQSLATFASLRKDSVSCRSHGRRLSVCQLFTSFPVCLKKLVNQCDHVRISDLGAETLKCWPRGIHPQLASEPLYQVAASQYACKCTANSLGSVRSAVCLL